MLPYENEAFLQLVEDDALVVMAKGLGLEKLFINMLRVYADSGNLVLVIGTTPFEENYFIEQLMRQGVKPLPKTVKADCNVNERPTLYMQGGVLFVTTRILVVDLLSDRIPIDLVTGILVYRAHRVVESAQEAFILRLYREKNKTGFVKAFTESPHTFRMGFCQVERVMRNLFVRKLHLWPRSHAVVKSSLEKREPEVVELHVTLTPAMLAIQTALLDLISTCVDELKRSNPTLDTDELTVENAISKGFARIVRMQLDPKWNQLSFKSKQLVADLTTLGNILRDLTQYDCVTFYNLVYSLRNSEKAFQESYWLFLDAAESLFIHAKERLFGKARRPTEQQAGKTGSEDAADKKPASMKFEKNLKWTALEEILKEIKQDQEKSEGRGEVLIITEDSQTSSQLRELLCTSSQELLSRLYEKTRRVRNSTVKPDDSDTNSINSEKSAAPNEPNKGKRKKDKHEKSKKDDVMTLTQIVERYESKGPDAEQKVDAVKGDDFSKLFLSIDPIMLHSLKDDNPFALIQLLHEFHPRYIIMYDVDIACVRRVEVFQAQKPKLDMKVYFLLYTGSVEEQRYLTAVRREMEAFEILIKEKATMVIPEERDGKTDDHPDLGPDILKANETVNPTSSRKGGGDAAAQQKKLSKKVLVDVREFRSALPSLVHRRGMEVVPLTLEVGDYILSPDICIERKSISDLIGSLNSGRLYNQAQAMTRYYKRPMLLIEYTDSSSFRMQSNYLTADVSSNDFRSKLVLLTLHFPSLRILWCSSSHETAELFAELKEGQDEPDEAKSKAQTGESNAMDKFKPAPQDFLSKLPGVSSKNMYTLLDKGISIDTLASLPVEKIAEILGNELTAKSLWESFHRPVSKMETSGVGAINRGKTRFKRRR